MNKYDVKLSEVKKGDVITCVETDHYDGKTYELKLLVQRVNKYTISVLCVKGYMTNSAWKIGK